MACLFGLLLLLGERAGGTVLGDVVREIASSLRLGDVVAAGGFVVVAPVSSRKVIAATASRFRLEMPLLSVVKWRSTSTDLVGSI